MVGPNLLARGEESIFALGDCASLVPEGEGRQLPATAQVANQQALHLIRHLPAWLRKGKPVPPYRFRDLAHLVALSDYNASEGWVASGSSGAASSGPFRAVEPRRVCTGATSCPLHGPYRALRCGLADRIACALGAAQDPDQLKAIRPRRGYEQGCYASSLWRSCVVIGSARVCAVSGAVR